MLVFIASPLKKERLDLSLFLSVRFFSLSIVPQSLFGLRFNQTFLKKKEKFLNGKKREKGFYYKKSLVRY